MTWFKVDDSFYDHPKVFDAPDAAVALWTRAGSWSSRNRTGGFVPAGMPARLCDDPDTAIRELVRRGLWTRTSGGYRFHDWSDYQPTAEEANATKQRQSSGGALGNHRRWHAGKGVIQPGCPYCQQKPGSDHRSVDRSPTDQSSDTVPESHANPPDPTRPDPTQKGGTANTATNGRARASTEPPRQCLRHLNDPDPPPCRRCADQRHTHDTWQRAQRDQRGGSAVINRDTPQCPHHRGQPAHNCAICRADHLAGDAP